MTNLRQNTYYLRTEMKRLLSFLLLCGILGQATIRTGFALHYQWNRAAYIKRCVNKDKPYLHCNGQCGFMKEIAAQEKSRNKEPQLPENFSEIKDIQLFFESAAFPYVVMPTMMDIVALPDYRVFVPEAPIAEIFRPPA